MKIINLVSENFKGIKAINITPDENFQIISGKNEQGKSSVLDSMWAAIEGKAALKSTDKPIRDGQEKAFVTVDLGDIIVTRRWKGDKTTLEVTAKDGAKYNSPQTMLDNMIGKLSFDPLSFSNQDEKKQKETLKELVGINFDSLDKDRARHYEERKFDNQAAEKLKGALSEMPFPVGAPEKEVSASDILNELKAANETLNVNNNKRRSLDALQVSLTNISTEIVELTAKLKEKNKQLDELMENETNLSVEVESLIDPDTAVIQAKLQNIEEENAKFRSAEKYRRIEKDVKEYTDSAAAKTKLIEDIDKLKSDTLQGAIFPIEGLSFDDNGVTFKNIPLKQCCDSEGLKVSVAMAMALNPKLRIIRMKNGSLLDSINMAMIKEMAKENDYQIWVEVVDESGTMGVVIEDGQVKEDGF